MRTAVIAGGIMALLLAIPALGAQRMVLIEDFTNYS
jgi:hypothetical protein